MNAEGSTECAATVGPPVARGLRSRDAANYIGFSEAFLKKARCGLTVIAGPRFKKLGSRVDVFLEQAA